MPYQPYKSERDPLRTFLALHQLQADAQARKDAQSRDALGLAMQLSRAGIDPSNLPNLDPNLMSQFGQLAGAARAETQGQALNSALQTIGPQAEAVAGNPALLGREQEAIRERILRMGGNEETQAAGLSSLESYVGGLQAKEQRVIRGEQRREAASMRAIGASEAANRRSSERAHELQLKALEEQARIKYRADYIEGAGAMIAQSPEALDFLTDDAVQQFGAEAPQVLERARFAGRVKVAKDLGSTAPFLPDTGGDEVLAWEMLKGQAYKDDLLDMVVRGSPKGEKAGQADQRAALYQVLADYDVATEAFAQAAIAMPGVHTVQDVIRRTGGDESPYNALLDVLKENSKGLILYARTGAASNLGERESIIQMLANPAQIRLAQNGKLDKATRIRLDALRRVIETEHLGRVAPERQREGRARMNRVFDGYRQDGRAWVDSYDLESAQDDFGATFAPSDTKGSAFDKFYAPPAAEPLDAD